MSSLKHLALPALCAVIAAPAAAAAVPSRLVCDLNRVAIAADIDEAGQTVMFADDGQQSRQVGASFASATVSFDDGGQPITTVYAIDRANLRIDRWIVVNREKSHLDRGKCRVSLAAAGAAQP